MRNKPTLENLVQRTELSSQFDLYQPNFLKNNCKKGDFVKVIATGERFWVKILANIDDENEIIGEVNNTLLNSEVHGFHKHDIIKMKRENIFAFVSQ
jgi:transcription elongation factor